MQTIDSPLLTSRYFQIKTVYGRLALLGFMILGSVLIAISAHIQIPFWPVPVTMQSLVILTIAMVYGWKLGMATIALYLFEGALGLPVFASGAGLAYFMGSTGGYLLGFLVAAGIIGHLAQKSWDQTFIKAAFANIIGTTIILLFGYIWLGYFYITTTDMDFINAYQMAFVTGVLPFIVGSIAKIALAALIIPKINRALR